MNLHRLYTTTLLSLAAVLVQPASGAPTPSLPSVSGSYGDRGIKVGASEPGASTADASLQGLLKLQFSPYAPDIDTPLIDRVVIRETREEFEVRGLDRQGKEVWQGSWRSGTQYVAEGDHRVLRLRSESQSDTAYALVFQPTADGKLLKVEVARLQATHFGPVPEPVGIYIFYRVPEVS